MIAPQEQIILLREALDKAWMALGRLVMEPGAAEFGIAPSNVEDVCDALAETLNSTDPELQGLSPRMRATYATYQPIEVLRFITNLTAKPANEPSRQNEEQLRAAPAPDAGTSDASNSSR